MKTIVSGKFPIRAGLLMLCTLMILLCTCGCTQSQDQTADQKQVAEVTVTQPNAAHIVVTYQGGPNMEKVIELETMITDSTGTSVTKSAGSRLATTPITIKGTNTIEGNFAGRDHVVVTGYFLDGSRKVLLDTTI